MTFSVLDRYINAIFIKKELERLRRELTTEISLSRQVALLLLEDDPLHMFLISQMPCASQMPLCLLFLFWRQIIGLFEDKLQDEGTRASALQEVALIIKNEGPDGGDRGSLVGCEDNSSTLFWSLDVLLEALKKLPPREAEIVTRHCSNAALGLADFVCRGTLHTCTEYNLYCYHRLGWLSVAVVQILCCAHADSLLLTNKSHLAGSVGVLIAKTDCIREKTLKWWPLELTSVYQTGNLENIRGMNFKLCRRRMIFDALKHLPDIYQLFTMLGSNLILRLLCSSVLENVEALAVMYRKDACAILPLELGWHYTIFQNTHSLTDFQHLLSESIGKIGRALSVDDPLYGQTSLLLAQLKAMFGKRRNYSLCNDQWNLTPGTIIELTIYSLLGLFLSLVFIRCFA